MGAPDFAAVLARLTMLKGEGPPQFIPEANKKALWMAMFILNETLKKQDSALFAPFVRDLASMVQE